MTATNVLVRVQAKGGKFLGPDAGYSRVTLRDAVSGTVLAQGLAQGDSGQLSGGFTPAATRQAIVTAEFGTQTLLWLSATPEPPQSPPTHTTSAGLVAQLELDAPTLVEFTAEALANGVPNGHAVTQTMWVAPGADLRREPGVVLVMPGVNVQILTPSLTTPAGESLSVTAWVAMMCGCKVDPKLPWPPAEFQVTAKVTQLDGDWTAEQALEWQATSTFGTPADTPFQLPKGGGNFQLRVTAVQAAEENVGSASLFFSVAPPPP